MSDNLSFLLTCAAECLNNWGYDGHGKHVDDGVKEITRLRAENEKLRAALKPFAAYVEQPARIYENEVGIRMALINQDLLMRLCQAAAAAIRESE